MPFHHPTRGGLKLTVVDGSAGLPSEGSYNMKLEGIDKLLDEEKNLYLKIDKTEGEVEGNWIDLEMPVKIKETADSVTLLKSQMEKLQTELDNIKTERDGLNKRIEDLKQDNTDKDNTIDLMTIQFDDFETKLKNTETLTNTIKEMEGKNNGLVKENEELNKQIEGLKTSIQDKEDKIVELGKQNENSKKIITDSIAKLKKQKEEMEQRSNQESSSQTQLTELNTKLEEKDKEIQLLKLKEEENVKVIDKLKNESNQHNTEEEKQNQELQRLRDESNTREQEYNTKLSELEKEIDQLNKEIEETKQAQQAQKQSELAEKEEALTAQLNDKENQINDLNNTLSQSEQTITNLQTEIDQLKNQLQNKEEELSDIQNQLEELEKQMANKDDTQNIKSHEEIAEMVKSSVDKLKLVKKISGAKNPKKGVIISNLEKINTSIIDKRTAPDSLDSFEKKLKQHFWNIHEFYLLQIIKLFKKLETVLSEYNKSKLSAHQNEHKLNYIGDLVGKFIKLSPQDKIHKDILTAIMDVFSVEKEGKDIFLKNLKQIK